MNEVRFIDVEIPAAAGGFRGFVPVRIPGKIITCLSASAGFLVVRDGGPSVDLSAGRAIGDRNSREFGTINFYNQTANVITARLAVSFEAYTPDIAVNPTVNASFSIKQPPTYTKMSGAPANAVTTFNGLDGTKQRKQIIVQNREAAGGNVIEVSDNTNEDDYRIRIAPGQIFTVETNGIIKVTVPAATNEAGVMETFYS